MAKPAPLFNTRRHPLLRKHIPLHENLTTVVIGFALVGLVLWVMDQRHRYDPSTRDLSVEQLLAASKNLELYHPPLIPWREPGSEPRGPMDIAPFPGAVVSGQWQPLQPPRQFGPDTLFEKINGEAPRFLKQGFQVLHYLVLKGPDEAEVAIELFDQGGVGGSMGLFSQHASGAREIERAGEVVYIANTIGAIGRVDRFFFRIAGSDPSPAVQDKARQLAEVMGQLISAPLKTSVAAAAPTPTPTAPQAPSDEPVGLTILRDTLEIPAELTAFQGENVFQFDFAQDFWFGRYSADTEERLFVHQAPSATTAEQLYTLLLDEQSFDYQRLDAQGMALLEHNFLGDNYFAVARSGQYIYGVENAPSPDRAQAVLARLAAALTP
ncbi:MAG: DUF6599 family protein [Candidatus Competibacterales bacterium]